MENKTKCKECDGEFVKEHFNQEFCTKECFDTNRRTYMKNYMARRRETLYFLLEDSVEMPDDRIKVAYYRTPGLHDFVHNIAKDNRVIALSVNGNETGVIIAHSASEEE
jgi:hypothetical protein|tara:strand:- start:452 stop:778 length:327 start_codon:yes stop_codon:yes gene_type:complete